MGPYEWITEENASVPSFLPQSQHCHFDDVTNRDAGFDDTQRSSRRIASLTPLHMTYVSLPSN